MTTTTTRRTVLDDIAEANSGVVCDQIAEVIVSLFIIGHRFCEGVALDYFVIDNEAVVVTVVVPVIIATTVTLSQLS